MRSLDARDGVPNLSDPARLVCWLRLSRDQSLQHLKQVVDRDTSPGPNVEDAARGVGCCEGGEVGLCDIVNVHEVTCLLSISVDGDWLRMEQSLDEDWDQTFYLWL